MTCALNARRSAICDDARRNLASAVRAVSASVPLTSAAATKPKTLIATVYSACRTDGSTLSPPIAANQAGCAYCHSTVATSRSVFSAASCSAPRRPRIVLAAMTGSRYSDENTLVTPPVTVMNAVISSASPAS